MILIAWISCPNYPDAVIHLYSFVRREGDSVNGLKRIAASSLGKFYKIYPQDEAFIKQGKRKPKLFVQHFDKLLRWEDAGLEAGYGYIYCLRTTEAEKEKSSRFKFQSQNFDIADYS